MRLAELVYAKGFRLASAIHPRATVADGVAVEGGTVIAAGGLAREVMDVFDAINGVRPTFDVL